ncbi:hypothetical protein BJD55_gp069 [Gordonia phage Yvonnetastic]|uniref:Uncharacterized protein n=1 Tax=Gordonia phage Yvonnetastic TaxID=1821566 RepID=A0A142K9B4_9CAUD|nr:hypothetical protein BJD55_gp069 [Gordonia phage Yvonnetastic]AMS02697.1 hypothetical protein SEA_YVONNETASTIC_153 [Gordonia phage Yvonnetastic]
MDIRDAGWHALRMGGQLQTKEDIRRAIEENLRDLMELEGNDGIVTDWFLGFTYTRMDGEKIRRPSASICSSNSSPYTLMGLLTYMGSDVADGIDDDNWNVIEGEDLSDDD